jgi:hypothetical protein
MRQLNLMALIAIMANFFLISLVSLGVAKAIPVYLRPDSQFSSGDYPQRLLEQSTGSVVLQRWLRVKTPKGIYGWLPEDKLLTPLKLATEALLLEDVPVRTERALDAIQQLTVTKNSRVLILEISGSWARTQPLTGLNHPITWIPTESLAPAQSAQTNRVFSIKDTALYLNANSHTRHLKLIKSGTILMLISEHGPWLMVQNEGLTGYVHRRDVWRTSTLGLHGATPNVSKAILRSAPWPSANIVTELNMGSKLEILDAKQLRWSQTKIKGLGAVWWPIDPDSNSSSNLGSYSGGDFHQNQSQLQNAPRIFTEELNSRPIFDTAKSPLIPQLQFASAQGVFRTNNGKEWLKLPLFKEENHSIAITHDGTIFIGPYLSNDQGATFQNWIRWDNLLASLATPRARQNRSLQMLRILEIIPEDSIGNQVTLLLQLGAKEAGPQKIRMTTSDQGATWKVIR